MTKRGCCRIIVYTRYIISVARIKEINILLDIPLINKMVYKNDMIVLHFADAISVEKAEMFMKALDARYKKVHESEDAISFTF